MPFEFSVDALYPNRRYVSAKVRYFMDLLGKHFRQANWTEAVGVKRCAGDGCTFQLAQTGIQSQQRWRPCRFSRRRHLRCRCRPHLRKIKRPYNHAKNLDYSMAVKRPFVTLAIEIFGRRLSLQLWGIPEGEIYRA
jgi:hypothetical protein